MASCSYGRLLGDRPMKEFFKNLWEAYKEVRTLQAKAVVEGHHWY